MPSLRSYIIRPLVKALSMRMNSIASIPSLRTFSDKISKSQQLPKGTIIERQTLDSIPVEWITQPGPVLRSVILYLHGGAWVLGWYQNHRVLAAYIGRMSRSRVVAVDYRLAPEHPFPESLDDCLSVYRQLIKDGIDPGQIVLAGDSAGANLSLALLFTLRDAEEALPAAVVCISPSQCPDTMLAIRMCIIHSFRLIMVISEAYHLYLFRREKMKFC